MLPLALKALFDYNVSMKTLIIIILLLIIAQTTTLEELKSIPFLGVVINDLSHSVQRIDDIERVVEFIEPEPTPWPTATPTVVRYE